MEKSKPLDIATRFQNHNPTEIQDIIIFFLKIKTEIIQIIHKKVIEKSQ